MTTLTKAELLAIARKQIFDEYIERGKRLDTWLEESEKAWKEEGIKIAYPSFPIYPFDGEVEERAELLKQQLSQKLDMVNTEAKPQEEPKVEEVLIPEPVEPEPILKPSTTIKVPVAVYYKRPKKLWSK